MRKSRSKGFTLIEILISLTVVVLLAILFLFATRSQMSKARDSKRKSDLNKIQKIVEDYYSDHQSYPDLLVCGDTRETPLEKYTKVFPCDPINSDEYYYSYAYDSSTANKMWYKVYAKLENSEDPIIEEIGCISGCGQDNYFNYFVSSSNIVGSEFQANEITSRFTPGFSATPTPTFEVEATPTTQVPTPTSTIQPTPTFVNLPENYSQCFIDSVCSSTHADVPDSEKACGWGCSGPKMCVWANPEHSNTVCCYNPFCPMPGATITPTPTPTPTTAPAFVPTSTPTPTQALIPTPTPTLSIPQQSCLSTGGQWISFPDNCGDRCDAGTYCLAVPLMSCDCGPNACWDANNLTCVEDSK